MNIAIVGGGNGGKSILESFSKIDDINVSIIIDKNINAPGIVLAKELGKKYSHSIDDIDHNNTDMIIEVTGSEKVANLLNEKYGGSCKIIDSKSAYLIMALIKQDMKTLDKLNLHIEAINETSKVVEEKLEDISQSINNISNISERLIHTTKKSEKYIKETDEIIRFVNNISKQVKILGLNATIESARAGEHGKGFSIVANEIQKLAENTQNFATQIYDILGNLSAEINKINGEVDNLNNLSQIQLDASKEVRTAVKKLHDETLV